MALKIKKIIDNNGQEIAPITSTKAVFDENGNTIDNKLNTLEGKASQVYDNFAAIESSGETNTNKIYIDGETLQPYIYKDGKFEKAGGGEVKTINGENLSGSGNIVINPTIMDLKWTTNTATTRKLVPIELRKKGVKIAYINASKVYIAEQYKVDDISDTEWVKDENWKGCRTPMTPLFEKGGAKFNDETGFYEMNELYDLTEDNMVNSYNMTGNKSGGNVNTDFNISVFSAHATSKIRTNFPFVTMFKIFGKLYLYGQTNLEIFTCNSIISGNQQPLSFKTWDLYACSKLRKILGYLSMNEATVNTYYKFPSVFEHGLFKRLKSSFDMLKGTPVIDYESIKYLVDNAVNTSEITITVHPTTYGYLTGTIQPTEQVGGTTAEWQQIVTDAQEKQISFASAE